MNRLRIRMDRQNGTWEVFDLYQPGMPMIARLAHKERTGYVIRDLKGCVLTIGHRNMGEALRAAEAVLGFPARVAR